MDKEIIPTKYYSMRKLVSMKILPWSSARTFKKRLTEAKWKNIFNPLIDNINNREIVHIKGENIIKFQTLADNGELNITND